jgi:hypothetical protein
MKTPMQELIKKLNEHTWHNEGGCPHVNISIINLDYFIEKEKQIIIEARTSKDVVILQAIKGYDNDQIKQELPRLKRDAEQYYNETFKQ